jgi:hypothetical protein
MSWDSVVRKFDSLAGAHASQAQRAEIVQAVFGLERIKTAELTGLLEKVR